MHRALELDPVSPAMNRDLGQLLFMQRDYDQAVEQFHKTRDLDQEFIGVYYWLGRAYEQKRMPEQTLAAFEQRLRWSKNTRILAAIAHLMLQVTVLRCWRVCGKSSNSPTAAEFRRWTSPQCTWAWGRQTGYSSSWRAPRCIS
jgi:tetratricopeptide (TPR) repeat protein